jgi:hypothetical protein
MDSRSGNQINCHHDIVCIGRSTARDAQQDRYLLSLQPSPGKWPGDVLIESMGRQFCCEGCKMVYEILHENDLCRYCDLDANPGISLKGRKQEQFAWLDDPATAEKLLCQDWFAVVPWIV